jgi:hypothetical protein
MLRYEASEIDVLEKGAQGTKGLQSFFIVYCLDPSCVRMTSKRTTGLG